MSPAQSIIRRIFSISRAPSGVRAPMTTPLTPRRRNRSISRHILVHLGIGIQKVAEAGADENVHRDGAVPQDLLKSMAGEGVTPPTRPAGRRAPDGLRRPGEQLEAGMSSLQSRGRREWGLSVLGCSLWGDWGRIRFSSSGPGNRGGHGGPGGAGLSQHRVMPVLLSAVRRYQVEPGSPWVKCFRKSPAVIAPPATAGVADVGT